jgi:hypothetical protein
VTSNDCAAGGAGGGRDLDCAGARVAVRKNAEDVRGGCFCCGKGKLSDNNYVQLFYAMKRRFCATALSTIMAMGKTGRVGDVKIFST